MEMKPIKRIALASFIDVIEPGKFPATFASLEDKANRSVLHVVRCVLERTVNFVSLRRFALRLSPGKTLRRVGLALENFCITAQKIRSIVYRLLKGRHRERKLRHLHYDRFIASDDGGFNFVQERSEIGLRKSVLI